MVLHVIAIAHQRSQKSIGNPIPDIRVAGFDRNRSAQRRKNLSGVWTLNPLAQKPVTVLRHDELAPKLAGVFVQYRHLHFLIFQHLALPQVPDQEADGKRIRSLGSRKVCRRKHEAVLETELKNLIAKFLVVVRVDVLQRGKQPEMCLFAGELLADAEKKLREQFARDFAESMLVHQRTNLGIADALLALAGIACFLRRSKRRIDEDDPLDIRVVEVAQQIGRAFARRVE